MTERRLDPTPVPLPKVQSVDRALRIVELLGEQEHLDGLSLSVIATHLGVAKSTTLALLDTLASHGYIARLEPGPRFRLGMTLMRLGDRVSQRMPFADIARPVLQSLAAISGLTARLVISDQGHPLYVSRVEGAGAVRFSSQLGRRELPHTTGVGKAILASFSDEEALRIVAENGLVQRTRNSITDEAILLKELTSIRERGYAVDGEEEAEGIVCVAASVHDRSGACLGAISVSGLSVHMTNRRVEELGEIVCEHADRLSARLGGADRTGVRA